jgi:hypothetical protein
MADEGGGLLGVQIAIDRLPERIAAVLRQGMPVSRGDRERDTMGRFMPEAESPDKQQRSRVEGIRKIALGLSTSIPGMAELAQGIQEGQEIRAGLKGLFGGGSQRAEKPEEVAPPIFHPEKDWHTGKLDQPPVFYPQQPPASVSPQQTSPQTAQPPASVSPQQTSPQTAQPPAQQDEDFGVKTRGAGEGAGMSAEVGAGMTASLSDAEIRLLARIADSADEQEKLLAYIRDELKEGKDSPTQNTGASRDVVKTEVHSSGRKTQVDTAMDANRRSREAAY